MTPCGKCHAGAGFGLFVMTKVYAWCSCNENSCPFMEANCMCENAKNSVEKGGRRWNWYKFKTLDAGYAPVSPLVSQKAGTQSLFQFTPWWSISPGYSANGTGYPAFPPVVGCNLYLWSRKVWKRVRSMLEVNCWVTKERYKDHREVNCADFVNAAFDVKENARSGSLWTLFPLLLQNTNYPIWKLRLLIPVAVIFYILLVGMAERMKLEVCLVSQLHGRILSFSNARNSARICGLQRLNNNLVSELEKVAKCVQKEKVAAPRLTLPPLHLLWGDESWRYKQRAW